MSWNSYNRERAPSPPRDRYSGGRDSGGPGGLPQRPRSPRPSRDAPYRSSRDGQADSQTYGGYGRDGKRDAPPSRFPPPPAPSYPPPPGYDHRGVAGQHRDSYRPDTFRPPQSDFTFRSEPSSAFAARSEHHYGSQGAEPRARERYRPGRPRGGGDRPNRGGSFRPFMRGAAHRPILVASSSQPIEDFASPATGAKYKAVEEVSDVEAAEASGNSGEEGPSKKKARTGADQAASVPKWSNPDPYDVLPAESVVQKTDVVAFIRKARVGPATGSGPTPAEEADDFIACDSDSDGEMPTAPPSNAPTGPRRGASPQQSQNRNKAAEKAAAPPAKLNPGRKRTHDDNIKLELPAHAKLKKASKMPVGGFISYDWRVTHGEAPCPWVQDHSQTPHMGTWLHKEIVDFYEHVRPRDFEQRLRQELVNALDRLTKGRFPDAEILAFGSFMSGLYLPTGDMDLVFCTRSFLANGRSGINPKRVLFQFRDFLVRYELADPDDIEVISKARVPLVKYIDSTTGLKVDVSFENYGGVRAIRTFLDWKAQYPVMPTLVTLVKHFLTMRGLNEPINGGIGGFSVICLVVSMLQHMPAVQSRDMTPEHHLGQLLMEFFDLYGNKFQYETIAISMNPPAYLPKVNGPATSSPGACGQLM